MPILKLFKSKSKDNNENSNKAVKIETAAGTAPAVIENGEDEELIAVISAAISAFLQKPVSGFRVVSFKKRGSWSNI